MRRTRDTRGEIAPLERCGRRARMEGGKREYQTEGARLHQTGTSKGRSREMGVRGKKKVPL